MTAKISIREATNADQVDVFALYSRAFIDEDLTDLVRALFDEETALLLVAEQDQMIVGHVGFTACGIDTSEQEVVILGPLAVDPIVQRSGIGSALVRAGLERVTDRITCVLGDPVYYRRFGFAREDRIDTPYPIPTKWVDGWQSLVPAGVAGPQGTLIVPAAWQDPKLWTET